MGFQLTEKSLEDLQNGIGTKADDDKPRMDLIPPDALIELGRLYAIGARKYSDNNWRKGMRWGRVYRALLSHALAFWRGETHDPETGIHHMIAVAWNAIALFTYDTNKVGEDDRVKSDDTFTPMSVQEFAKRKDFQ